VGTRAASRHRERPGRGRLSDPGRGGDIGAIAHVPLPIPTTVVPGGVFKADTQFVIGAQPGWVLLDRPPQRLVDATRRRPSRRSPASTEAAAVDGAVTRDFCTERGARRGSCRARGARPPAARGAALAAQHSSRPCPRVLQARGESRARPTPSKMPRAAGHDANMALLEASASGLAHAIEIADVSKAPAFRSPGVSGSSGRPR
jgi:hypothetical protein